MAELTQPTAGGAQTNSVATPAAREPTGPHIWEAMKRHWVLTILPVLILVPIAVGLGIVRSPKYKAESRLIVGRLSITNPGLAGFVTATQSLAAAYARAVTAAPVTGPVGKRVGLSSKEVSSRLEGSPIQLSPVFRVIATGKSSAQAILLANESSTALINYVSVLNRENPDGPDLLKKFRKAAREFSEANLDVQAAQSAYDHSPTPGNKQAVNAAAAVRSAAELEKNTFGALYTGSEAGQSTASLVSPLSNATTSTSDRSSVIQMLVLVAIIVGLLIGTALATSADRRERRRAAA